MRTTRLRVVLRDVSPTVVRVLDVPSASTLDEVHELLQAGLGWTDSHLHEFDDGAQRYQHPGHDGFDDVFGPAPVDERTATLGDLPATWTYTYDFGDGWTHDVVELGRGADEPGCVDGEAACPPEDCGGPFGYEQLLAVLGDPAHPEHLETRRWAGDLPVFDRELADLRVRQAAGRVPPGVQLVLDLAQRGVGVDDVAQPERHHHGVDGVATDGVRLTPGGRFPRWFVRRVLESRPEWAWFGLEGRPAHLEEDVLPLIALRELMRDAGLLRLRHGVLTPIRAARDQRRVVRGLRSALARDEFGMWCAELAVALLLVDGPFTMSQLAAQVFPLLGHGWRAGERLVVEDDVRATLGSLTQTLLGLDQIVEVDHRSWRAGPEAHWVMRRVPLLAARLTG